ncbi:unnamed protein product [Lactuca saligna]|uniref:TIR domain-containing protein n=1 Tax=Lactuca saligna TaxID=75948 RepID=A0AA35VKN1_LACSI|nr:unnamed protein product [Lactuca saligna]
MESYSTSSIQKSYKYDVFLSFAGQDVRKNFLDHLYVALQWQEIVTFKDDENLDKGKRIKDDLFKSIEESKFHIIILSKAYAASTWCLDELVKIMECQNADNTKQIAYPVFYDVDPTDVRHQRKLVETAFAENKNKPDAGKWIKAMEGVAGLAGWDLRNTDDGHEAKVIKRIVEKISLELRSTNLKADEYLVGMESRIRDIVSSLEMDVEDVRMIGIKGIGGGGKTTLATAVFDKICFPFEVKSIVGNIREVSKSSMFGLQSLQKQVLSIVIKDRNFTISTVRDGKSLMKKNLSGKKVLLVLDDVDHLDQLEALVGALNWFKGGSRIIITTRDEQLLIAHGVKAIHDVTLLSQFDATRVFNRYAFGKDIPIKMCKELSLQAVRYAAGLPLTIKVLGSFLCGKDELEWKDALERLKKIPLKETLEKLELSYTSLDHDYQDIFLDVACLLKGWRKDDAIRALECCGYHARIGLRVLEQRSLLTISRNQELGMHDHIQELGRNIVRRLHPAEPIRHTRLWIRGEIEDLLTDDLVTEATRAITTHTYPLLCEQGICRCRIFTKGFGNMKKLRFLQVTSSTSDLLEGIEVGKHLPNALRFLNWRGYPHSFLPKTFQANNLVALEMPYGRIKRLWEEGERKALNNLRYLDMSHSDLTTLDCGLLPNLEKLNLKKCSDLVKLNAPHGSLRRLARLDLRRCQSLDTVSFIRQLELLQVLEDLIFLDFSYSSLTTLDCGLVPNLEKLIVENCYNLVELQLESLQFLNLGCLDLTQFSDIIPRNNIQELPSFIGNLQNLVSLKLYGSKNLRKLQSGICVHLRHLKHLDLEGSDIEELPEDLGHLESLETLELGYMPLKHLPNSICMLTHLKTLLLDGCKGIKELPEDLGLLESLEELSLGQCKIRDVPSSICKLKLLRKLYLRYCDQLKGLPEKLGDLECLEDLNLEEHRCQEQRVQIQGYHKRKFCGIKTCHQDTSKFKDQRLIGLDPFC